MADEEKEKVAEQNLRAAQNFREMLRGDSPGVIPRGRCPSRGMTYGPDPDTCRGRCPPLHLPWKNPEGGEGEEGPL